MTPAAHSTMSEGIDWDTLLNSTNVYVTVVVKPGSEKTDGVFYYSNGELLYHYVARTKSDKGFTVAQFTELFLRCAQVSGVYVNGSTGTAFATTDMFIESRALTAEQVTTRYNNYLSENASYPHNHTWGADNHCTQCDYLNPDHTHIYENGVCTVRGCGMVDPHHEHVYSSALDKYDHCTVCGEINPLHAKTGLGGQKHVYDETLHCYACGSLDPHHTSHDLSTGFCVCGEVCKHNFVDGVCTVCGAANKTVNVDNVSYESGNAWAENYTYTLPVQFRYSSPITITGTQEGDVKSNWLTALVRLSAGGEDYTIRFDRWTFGAATLFATGAPTTADLSITDAAGTVTATGDSVWDSFANICKNSTWSVTLSWMTEDTLTISIKVTSLTDGSSFNCVETYGAVADVSTVFDVKVSGDDVKGWSVTSYIALPSD